MKTNLSLFFIINFLFFACETNKKEQLTHLVQKWQGKEILFPRNITFTQFVTDTVNYKIPQTDYKVLIFVDSNGCTSCKLQLPKWKKLITHVDSITGGRIPFLFFFQSKNDKELRYILERDHFNRPICIDHKNELNQLNQFPNDMTFQTFLLDKNNKVKVIGNPIHNLAIQDLYLEQITGKHKEIISQTTIQTDQKEYNLGTIKGGTIQEQKVKIKNTGNQFFQLKGFTTSCDCTEAICEWKEIAPGKTAIIKIRYKAEKAGKFFRTITIYGNITNQSYFFHLIGEVKNQ